MWRLLVHSRHSRVCRAGGLIFWARRVGVAAHQSAEALSVSALLAVAGGAPTPPLFELRAPPRGQPHVGQKLT